MSAAIVISELGRDKGQINKSHYSALHDAIVATPITSGKGETEYFEFRAFRNGNLHLKVRRLDLLERFNALAGGKRLRGEKARGAA